MSKIAAEYVEGEAALAAARALVDAGIPPRDIEIRSPYPLPEAAIPPHRSARSHMRNLARGAGVVGAVAGFTLLAYTQTWWDLKTDWHPVVSLPINAVVAFECGALAALFATVFMFFLETRNHRRLTPPLEEDLPVAHGHVVLVVEGESAGKAETLLKDSGYRSLVPFVMTLALLGLLGTGCGKYRTVDWTRHNMRDQQALKPTEVASDPAAPGVLAMPTRMEQLVPPPAELGWMTAEKLSVQTIHYLPPKPSEEALKNPLAPDDMLSLGNGRRLFETNCAACHGATGQGDGPVGKVFAPTPANLTGQDSPVARKSDGSFYHWTAVGKTTMPPFGMRLAPVEIWDVVNYLRYLHGGGSPEAVKPVWRKDLRVDLAPVGEPAGLRTQAPAAPVTSQVP